MPQTATPKILTPNRVRLGGIVPRVDTEPATARPDGARSLVHRPRHRPDGAPRAQPTDVDPAADTDMSADRRSASG